MKPTVFVLEPDAEQLRLITDCLEGHSYEVDSAAESAAGMSTVLQNNPGVVVLAEDMPTPSGMDPLTLLRKRSTVPVIVTGKGNETAVVAALLEGADMYLAKPIDYREMVCRVGALLRREDLLTNGKAVDVSALESDLPEAVKNALTDTERRLFRCLMERVGRVVRHEDLMVKVWGKPVKPERLRFFIHSLRKKLAATDSINLHTRNGIGYLLENQSISTDEVV